jgi:hypothetical protein
MRFDEALDRFRCARGSDLATAESEALTSSLVAASKRSLRRELDTAPIRLPIPRHTSSDGIPKTIDLCESFRTEIERE